jgi:hypothetical protein
MTVHIIKEVGFASWENHIAAAISSKVLGYAKSLEAANAFIEEKRKQEESYKGWDGNWYPKYTIQTIEEV